MFCRISKKFPAFFILSQLFSAPNTILVTNNDSNYGQPGSLGAAILAAVDDTIIDCSPIAGQTIAVSNFRLPAIGYNFTSPTSSLTILGSGVIIDGGSTYPVFSLAQGSANITGFTIQNGSSRGGAGGAGFTGGGGGTGGGGALYIHSGTVMTISTTSLNDNQAIGGAGGAGIATNGGSGGGGGGFGGGTGGFAGRTGATAGSGAGGGGNNGGTAGGRDGGVGSPNTFTNFAGAGGGGEMPGAIGAKSGGHNASIPSRAGGTGGTGNATYGAGGGGGAGSGGSGLPGTSATPSSGGTGGMGGAGFGAGNSYGAGGGGGGGGRGGAGVGTSGGGGGLKGPGGDGGVFGGGGGASSSSPDMTYIGGAGGFGAGGGAGHIGGTDIYGLGGTGGSATNATAGGGGGSGLGGAIFIQQGGKLIIQDGVSFSGNSTTAGLGGAASGSSGGNGSALGQDIFIQAGGSLTFDINGAVTIPNPIEGGGLLSQVTEPTVMVSGVGTVHLNGTNTYLGDTVIQSGILNLNGSIGGDAQIESSGTLSGNATVNGSLYSHGTISPGNSISPVFTTNLYLYPTSIYNVEIDSAGNSDTIIASGVANLNGSVTVTTIDNISSTTPLTYTILSTSSGVTGSFSLLTSTTPALMSLIYNPLSVQLTYLPLETIGLTGDALNAATCFATLGAFPDASAVANVLFALSFNDIQKAFTQMSPAQFSPLSEVQLLDALLVRSTYTKHLEKFCHNNNPRYWQHFSVWVDGIGQWQNQKTSGSQFGYRDTTYGGTVGFDYRLRHLTLGLAVSSLYDTLHLKNFGTKAHMSSYYGGFYGQWNTKRLYVNTAVLSAFNHYTATREINFGTINRRAHSKHKGSEWLVNLGFGYQACKSNFQWSPYINLDYVQQYQQSYAESGAQSLNLHVHAKNSGLFQGEAGVLLSTTWRAGDGVFVPTLTVAYMNQTPLSSKTYHANFVNSSCTFKSKGGSYERNLFAPSFILTYVHDGIHVALYYDAEVNRQYWAQDAGIDLTFRF